MRETKQRILVADDERPIVQMASMYLALEGYEVIPAYDGVECLAKARSEKPDLILLDLLMPHKDGWEVLEELRSDRSTRGIPVVILTVLTDDLDYEKAQRLKTNHYLTKPFEPVELLAIIRRLLSGSSKMPS